MSPAVFTDLPNEVLLDVFKRFENKDLLASRRVSRRFRDLATACFQKITTIVPDESQFRHLKLTVPQTPIAQGVNTVRIQRGGGSRYLVGMSSDTVVDQYDQALQHASRFPNLCNISLSLSAHLEVSAADFEGVVADAPAFKVLQKLLRVATAKPLKSLTLTCVPPLHTSFTQSPMFKPCMSTVKDLELEFDAWYHTIMSHQTPDPDFPTTMKSHDFTNNIADWIQHSREILTRLSLSFQGYAGYYPKLDFDGLHYPRLRVLELACVTFTHKAHVSWILTHASTLTTLRLVDCPIIVIATTQIPLDNDGYPVAGEPSDQRSEFTSNFTWHSVLTCFLQLLLLKNFSVEFVGNDLGVEEPGSGMHQCRYQAYCKGQLYRTTVSYRAEANERKRNNEVFEQLLVKMGQGRVLEKVKGGD